MISDSSGQKNRLRTNSTEIPGWEFDTCSAATPEEFCGMSPAKKQEDDFISQKNPELTIVDGDIYGDINL